MTTELYQEYSKIVNKDIFGNSLFNKHLATFMNQWRIQQDVYWKENYQRYLCLLF
jgi:hypothetical protein